MGNFWGLQPYMYYPQHVPRTASSAVTFYVITRLGTQAALLQITTVMLM
jgi:hypothetical protein